MAKEATLEDIERSYDAAIDKAKGAPEVVAELKSERSAAVAEFRLKQVAAREQALWKREALNAWPLAVEFPEMVVGATEDEVVASAKALHERMLARFDVHQHDLEVKRLIDEHFNPKPPEGGEENESAVPEP